MWDVGQTVYAHSQWEHLFVVLSRTGGSVSCDVSKAIGGTSVTQLELSKISLAARYLFRAARVLLSRP